MKLYRKLLYYLLRVKKSNKILLWSNRIALRPGIIIGNEWILSKRLLKRGWNSIILWVILSINHLQLTLITTLVRESLRKLFLSLRMLSQSICWFWQLRVWWLRLVDVSWEIKKPKFILDFFTYMRFIFYKLYSVSSPVFKFLIL